MPAYPTSVSLSAYDRDLLAEMHRETGILKSEIVRRLLRHYAEGGKVKGLPAFRSSCLKEPT